jgi:NEDD4-binding protein 2
MKNQILVVMQGASGSGKTTLAKHIASVIDAEVYSTDDFFMVDGQYKFDPTKLAVYHKLNQDRAIAAMENGANVVIDNTNIQAWQARPYVAYAVEHGITVKFVRATGDFQNLHGVPAEKVEKMRASLEPLSVESVMAS